MCVFACVFSFLDRVGVVKQEDYMPTEQVTLQFHSLHTSLAHCIRSSLLPVLTQNLDFQHVTKIVTFDWSATAVVTAMIIQGRLYKYLLIICAPG